jgi:membrane fusion protein (multidrug efflux system)
MEAHESSEKAGPEAQVHGEGEVFDPAGFRPTGRGLGWSAIVAAGLLAGLSILGIVPRVLHRSAMADETRALEEEPVHVSVVRAQRSVEASNLVLPGSVQPLQETSVYARANGYVRVWRVDIGARVKKGQVLAELDIPDIDEELRQGQAAANQAVAGIAQAKTQLDLARTTNRRYGALGPSGVVTQQEVDQYQSAYDAQQANVAAAEAAHGSTLANVHRLQDLKSFGVIVAPFDGVVTQRSAEVGQLVTAGTGAGPPLFKVAEVDTVRVFVNVPQLYAARVKVGMSAPVTVRELPGRTFTGKVARTANELDMATRTLLTEVDIPNPDDTLISGMYGQVSFHMTGQNNLLFVPATAILIDASGTRAAVVREGAISWKGVEIDGDLGDRLALSTGLTEGDLVVVAPSDRLAEGTHVRAQEGQPSAAPSAESKPKSP